MAPSAMVAARKRAQQGKKPKASKKQKNDFRKSPDKINHEQRSVEELPDDTEEEEEEEEPNETENNNNKDNASDSSDDDDEYKRSKNNDVQPITKKVSEEVQTSTANKNENQNYLDLYLDDAPVKVLPGEIRAAIKSVVNTHLFKGVKFYHNTQSATRVVGYVFDKIHKGGLENQAFRRSIWNAACDYIAFRTGELRQQCVERWYAVLYGTLLFLKHYTSFKISNQSVFIVTQRASTN